MRGTWVAAGGDGRASAAKVQSVSGWAGRMADFCKLGSPLKGTLRGPEAVDSVSCSAPSTSELGSEEQRVSGGEEGLGIFTDRAR